MKFGKEFKKEMVPEWIEAYVDYTGLKHILQEIRRFKESEQPQTPARTLEQRLALYRNFSGLNLQGSAQNAGDIEDQVIAVNTVQHENYRKFYKTKFLASPEGAENEISFFNKLDHEFNKVNTFYKDKVDEVMREVTLLNKQMDALIALRIKVMDPGFDAFASLQRLSLDINNSTPSRITSPLRMTNLDTEDMPVSPSFDPTYGRQGSKANASYPMVPVSCNTLRDNRDTDSTKTDPLEILDHIKIVNTFESPMSTIRGVLSESKENDLSYKKEELKKVEHRLKLIFIELYQKLRHLKHFSYINLSAFSKILKKYEKITSRKAARSYLKMVDNSYLGSSEEVTSLLDRVETTFIKHFSQSNRREGMKILRPRHKREKHRITFLSGFFSGCSIALLVAVILLRDDRKLIDKGEGTSYLDKIVPLYSFYAYIVLHMLLYATNIYFWRRYKINYAFIFGFKQGTELSYREIFLLSNGLAMLVLAALLMHLHMNARAEVYGTSIEYVPLGLIMVLLSITFCPLNIIYRSSRLFLIKCVFRCICAPLYKVTLPDFFLADQLTSQVEAIRSLEYYICYYTWVKSSHGHNSCQSHNVYNIFYFILAIIPYWFRFFQCVRRLFEEKDQAQAYNGLRYFLTILAVVIKTAYVLRKSLTWEVLAILSSLITTFFNTYWDIVVDWGLLRRKSKNKFLRDKLILRHKSVYFIAMVLDVLLRFAWLQLVLKFNVPSLRGSTVSSIFACLEVIRRGMWNFFRLENEHLNNVGKYRAFKSVPLPFAYHEEDEEKEE
ncbi:phosphate transporter PHO1 homolog 10-like [Lycium ferocissimum]|uniref:phosphate transporter PHO1 homolog 10-like n=1 Tax=Lycium ferocissimum TaxID=112874 RepID=UPI0028168375|nr:phosphate transporter PHO1 homolog 10-like [Lycium ferocissimum]XP_059317310.1 phosphate transporter PHO1 homolog 10-like [Lycium ferocissimum]XP_059317311.1 phosphate transporter PHO1 homolog 10-like [Lycium ferocissimum]